MTTARKISVLSLVKVAVLASVAATSVGCATGGGAVDAPLALAPGGQHADLAGTRWKLPMSEGGLDGRTIEFKYANRRYEGVLTKVGRQLTNKIGAREGLVLMELVPSRESPGSFQGIERVPGRDENTEIFCSVAANGREMKCNAESTPWQRI